MTAYEMMLSEPERMLMVLRRRRKRRLRPSLPQSDGAWASRSSANGGHLRFVIKHGWRQGRPADQNSATGAAL